jgi:hypothetical protein
MAKTPAAPPPGVTQEYDIAYAWRRGDKTGWNTVGKAFVNDEGRIRLSFWAMPFPGLADQPGSFMLFPKASKAEKKSDETPKPPPSQEEAPF